MADLPDLDTSTISYVAYWNAIDDGGVNSIDPESVLDNGSVIEYTLYDNGVTFSYDAGNYRELNVRVKSDGWIAAYLDRTENFNSGNSDPTTVPGWWDILYGWKFDGEYNGPSSFTLSLNLLSRAVQDINNSLDAATSLNTADIGIYNYEYESGTNTAIGTASSSNNNNTQTVSFTYTSSTTLYAEAVLSGTVGGGSSSNRTLTFDGSTIFDIGATGDNYYAAYDPSNQITSAGTEYATNLDISDFADGVIANVIIWS